MAPMQWPGTTDVLEKGPTGVRGRPGLSSPGLGGPGLGSPGLRRPELGGPGIGSPDEGNPQLSSKVLASADLPCRDEPELFFAESPEDVEFAKSLCGSCAARLVCLAGAMDRAEPWGVWGGELFLRGEVVPRKRPRGRPRKDAVAA
jgi:WhiB family redox-sensing transcriptional regulator